MNAILRNKTQHHCEITTVGPCAIYERIIYYLSTVLMFIILTHDNQRTFSSFSLLLSFVTNNHVTEKVLSGSPDLVLIVIKAWNSFFKVI